MLRWLAMLLSLSILTLVSIVGVARREPVPMVVSARESHNRQWVTFNQTLDGKYKREILTYGPRSSSNLNWSPDGTSTIIVDSIDGTVYRYQRNSHNLERMYYMSPFTPNKFVRWSNDGTSFLIVSSSNLLIFHDGQWYTFWNGLPGIEDAYWVGNRIVILGIFSGISSIAADGSDRKEITRESDRLIGVFDRGIYTYMKYTAEKYMIYKVDIVDPVLEPIILFEPTSTTMAISPDGHYLIYVGQGHTPNLLDLESGDDNPLIKKPFCELRCDFRWSPDSEHLLIYHDDPSSNNGNWFHVDLGTRTMTQITHSGNAFGAEWMPFRGFIWHPLWLALGAAFVLIVKIGLWKMV